MFCRPSCGIVSVKRGSDPTLRHKRSWPGNHGIGGIPGQDKRSAAACIGVRRQGGRMNVFGGKRLSGDGGLRGECTARDVSAYAFFIGSLPFICSGVFSHLNKVRRERSSAVAFSGSLHRIFLHRLFAHLLKIHPARMNRSAPFLFQPVDPGFFHERCY